MIKCKLEEVINNEINTIIRDIRIFLVGNETYDFETNQFQGYIIIDQFRSNFRTIKYHKYNKVLSKVYIKFYNNCQNNYNKVLHNEEIQRKRIIEQFENE